jgi:signal transduction histidine kinase/CheY-like chemotaxis protein
VLYPAAATLLRFALLPILQERVPFLLYFPAVLLTAYAGGLGPGLAATVVSVLASMFFFIEPTFSFGFDDPVWYIRLALFALVCAAISVVCDRMRSAQQQAEASARVAREQALEAERASRLKDEFLATVSHELRNPLNAMLGWVRVLRAGRRDEASLARGLEVVERNTVALNRLIEDLLDVSRIVSGKMHLDVQSVDVAQAVESAVESVRLAAEAKEVSVDVALDPDVGTVSGDAARVQQVVWNLLSNAVRFNVKGGRVTVRSERVGPDVRLTVSDTGRGIEPEFLPHVFERFRQEDGTSTRHHGGLGLGLAIVRHLVELHGGSVRVESDGVGKGATFAVVLPAGSRDLPADRGPATPAAAPPLTLAGLRVLVVEDEPDTRDLLGFVLGRHGADVVVAASADEAAAEARARWPDVLVTDIGMPERDGYELLAELCRMSADGRRLPAIALTAYARNEDRTRALEAGFDAHLAKPIEPDVLVAAVARSAGRPS